MLELSSKLPIMTDRNNLTFEEYHYINKTAIISKHVERKDKYKCTFSTIKSHERLQKVINGKYHGKIFNIKVTSVYLPLMHRQ